MEAQESSDHSTEVSEGIDILSIHQFFGDSAQLVQELWVVDDMETDGGGPSRSHVHDIGEVVIIRHVHQILLLWVC